MTDQDYSYIPISKPLPIGAEFLEDGMSFLAGASLSSTDLAEFGVVLQPPPDYQPIRYTTLELFDIKVPAPNRVSVRSVPSAPGFYEFSYGKDKKKREPVTIGEIRTSCKDADLDEWTDELVLACEKEFWTDLRGSSKTFKHSFDYASDNMGSFMSTQSSKFSLANTRDMLQNTVHCFEQGAGGITMPETYIGSEFSQFPPHKEDKDLMSISYLVKGAPKVWYVVPTSETKRFEAIAFERLKGFGKHNGEEDCPNVFRHKLIQVDVRFFKENNIPLVRHIQREGQFVCLPEFCYHFGFNTSFNVAEAINATSFSWIPYGLLSLDCPFTSPLRKRKPTTKELDKKQESDTVESKPKSIPVPFFVYDYQFELYNDLVNGNLQLVHPKDPQGIPQRVSPPLDDIWTLEEYDLIGQDIDQILAYRTVNGVQQAYVFAASNKFWMTRDDVEKMHWKSKDPVKVPDQFFNVNLPVAPPIMNNGRFEARAYHVEFVKKEKGLDYTEIFKEIGRAHV